MRLDIADIAVTTATKYAGIRWFEATVRAFTDTDRMVIFSIDFPVNELKEMGVCNNLNGWKKVREWARTEAGHEYIMKNRFRKDMLIAIIDGDIPSK